MLHFTFEKNNLLSKKERKKNLSLGKIPAPPSPPDIKWSLPKAVLCKKKQRMHFCSVNVDTNNISTSI